MKGDDQVLSGHSPNMQRYYKRKARSEIREAGWYLILWCALACVGLGTSGVMEVLEGQRLEGAARMLGGVGAGVLGIGLWKAWGWTRMAAVILLSGAAALELRGLFVSDSMRSGFWNVGLIGLLLCFFAAPSSAQLFEMARAPIEDTGKNPGKEPGEANGQAGR